MRLQGQTAIVTGGCSGLGFAATLEFLNQGCQVVIIDRNAEQGLKIKSDLGYRVTFIQADITQEEEVKRAYDQAFQKFKEIRIFLLSAGLGKTSRMISSKGKLHSTGLFKQIINVNLIGTFLCAKYAAYHMKDLSKVGQERGVIITVASNLGFEGNRYFIAYSASKAAVMGMMLPMARDLGRLGIRVVSIAPGLIKTPFLGDMDESGLKFVAKQTALGRLQTPEEFAHLARVLAENSFINAVTIRADGGFINPHI